MLVCAALLENQHFGKPNIRVSISVIARYKKTLHFTHFDKKTLISVGVKLCINAQVLQ